MFSKLLTNKIVRKNNQVVVKKSPWPSILSALAVTALVIFAIWYLKPSLKFADQMFERIKAMFEFKDKHDGLAVYTIQDTFYDSLELLGKTIAISVIGTLAGILLAVPLSLLCSKAIAKSKAVVLPVRIILSIIRAFPPIIIAMLALNLLSPTFAGVVTIIIFVTTIMTKWLYEELDSINMETYESLQAFGNSKIRAIRKAVWPIMSQKVISYGLYSFEIVIRFSAILGIVGVATIGSLINENGGNPEWMGHLTISLSILVVTIILIEALSRLFNKYVLKKQAKPIDLKIVENLKTEITVLKGRLASAGSELKSLEKELAVVKADYNDLLLKSKQDNKSNKKQLDKLRKNILQIKSAIRSLIKQSRINSKKLISSEKRLIANKKLVEELKVKKDPKIAFVKLHKPKIWIVKLLVGLGVIGLLAWSFTQIEWTLANATKVEGFKENLPNLFKFDWDKLAGLNGHSSVIMEALVAVVLAIAATGIGVVLGFIFGILASKNITGKVGSWLFKLMIIIIRTVPAFVYVIIILPAVPAESISFAGALALGIHSIGMLGKLTYEKVENLDKGGQQALKVMGASTSLITRWAVISEAIPTILSNAFYRIEINFKSTIEVGAVGASIFGLNVKNFASDTLQWEQLSNYILVTVVIVLIIEQISNLVRTKLMKGYFINPNNILIRSARHWRLMIAIRYIKAYNLNRSLNLQNVKAVIYEGMIKRSKDPQKFRDARAKIIDMKIKSREKATIEFNRVIKSIDTNIAKYTKMNEKDHSYNELLREFNKTKRSKLMRKNMIIRKDALNHFKAMVV